MGTCVFGQCVVCTFTCVWVCLVCVCTCVVCVHAHVCVSPMWYEGNSCGRARELHSGAPATLALGCPGPVSSPRRRFWGHSGVGLGVLIWRMGPWGWGESWASLWPGRSHPCPCIDCRFQASTCWGRAEGHDSPERLRGATARLPRGSQMLASSTMGEERVLFRLPSAQLAVVLCYAGSSCTALTPPLGSLPVASGQGCRGGFVSGLSTVLST